jgi:hypothetical protein
MTLKLSLPLTSSKMVWVWVTDRAKKIKLIRLSTKNNLKA